MLAKGIVCANKSIKKYESLLWWSIQLYIVSDPNLVNTRVRYGFSKLKKKNVFLLKINEICLSVKTSYKRLFSNSHQLFSLSQQFNPKAWGCSFVIWISIHGLTPLIWYSQVISGFNIFQVISGFNIFQQTPISLTLSWYDKKYDCIDNQSNIE